MQERELVGHTEVTTTRRYITVGEDQKRAAFGGGHVAANLADTAHLLGK